MGARSLAFPAISAGVYGWAPAEVARIAVDAVRRAPMLDSLEHVQFVLFSPQVLAEFERALAG